MKTLLETLQIWFDEAIVHMTKGHGPLSRECLPAEISLAMQDSFGHYQCNSALKMAKILGLPPRNIAQKIIEALPLEARDSFARIEIAGPGFINIVLNASFLGERLLHILKDPKLGCPPPLHKEKIIVEFSSPNVAKELHVGHLRSTIIGDSLARLFEFLGYQVLRLNHIGDWGTQFGMLIAYIKEKESELIHNEEYQPDLSVLMHWYREAKKYFDANETFKKVSQREVILLQSGDPQSLRIWEKICDISRRAFNDIYRLLDIHLVERGESYYNPYLKGLVKELEDKGIVDVSDGAKCIFLDGFLGKEGLPQPMIIQKSDGGFNYDTTDMAAIKHRIEHEKAVRVIYVTDAGQSLHFQMIFKAAERAGYLDRKKIQVDHVPFGVVLGSDGKKFKTRSGDTERLIDLISGAIEKAEEILKERMPELEGEELKKYSHILGVNALKYADLSCNRVKDYMFSYERMLRFDGNTAAFIMYSYVRAQGIKRRVNKDLKMLSERRSIKLGHPTEITLALHLLNFADCLQAMAKDLLPNRLTDYLYDLSERFNAFFRDCHVEGTEEEEDRLLLCEIVSRVLHQGMSILGLHALEKM